jgi:hypothetical protein
MARGSVAAIRCASPVQGRVGDRIDGAAIAGRGEEEQDRSDYTHGRVSYYRYGCAEPILAGRGESGEGANRTTWRASEYA